MNNRCTSIPSPDFGSNLGGETEDTFQVRDQRKGHWFWIHNALIDRAGPHIGPVGIAIYGALARFAGTDSQAWPSHTTLARILGISRHQVRHALERLERLRLIAVDRPQDPRRTHGTCTYILTDPAEWVLPDDNEHAQLPAPQKSASKARKDQPSDELRAQPKTEAPETRLGSETQNTRSLRVSDGNGKNADSNTVADMPKMQNGTARAGLREVENAQGNGENGRSNFGEGAINNTLLKQMNKTHHHDDAIRSLKKLGVANPRELLAWALREGWASGELADVAERLRQVPPEKVANPAGLLVRLIPQGYRAALEAVKRYAPDKHQEEEQSERAKLIEAYADAIRLYQFPGLPDYEKAEVERRGLELRARLKALGVDVDAVRERVVGKA